MEVGVESHRGLQEAAADAVNDGAPAERGGRGCEDVHSYSLTILSIWCEISVPNGVMLKKTPLLLIV